jgi:cytochrome o ubiquinol oxidase subunit 3
MDEVIAIEPAEKDQMRDKLVFGFWIYLMTDLIMFAVLFAVYAVLHENTFGGPGTRDLFDLKFVLTETLILLTSSFTCGLASLAVETKNKKNVLTWFGVTFVLGAAFLAMELSEFSHLIAEGHTFTKSAFLSSYFTLVGTHGLHIFVGLSWLLILLIHVAKRGVVKNNIRKLTLLAIFWHFLDIVWIFIFTVVYLMGVL